ncbi:hypothetical protein [Streptosporangium sp. KLBMP 9127]|nr:hypothetical protein [Streptosporangium sp. KLBMP 9127]
MSQQDTDLGSLIEKAQKMESPAVPFEGYATDDMNRRDHMLLVQSPQFIYSFAKADIKKRENVGERVRLWVAEGAQAFRISSFIVDSSSPFTVGMENIAAPESVEVDGAPSPATVGADMVAMENIAPPVPRQRPGAPSPATKSVMEAPARVPALSSVAEYWTDSCSAGDAFANNCAHFLSDAFIRAGYTELRPPNPHIHARCYTPAKRPIRARNMWSWFKSKAERTSRDPQPDTGWWAVFQLKESVYWGGHVALLDSDTWNYYGTGWYPDWDQYAYQW